MNLNVHVEAEQTSRGDIAADEWAARVELAALYHLLDRHVGWHDGIYTHATLRVPGEPDKMLIKRFDLLYCEVTASNLVKIAIGADVDESSGANRPGVILHSGAMAAREDINCGIHIHTNEGLALSAHANGLRMITQNSLRFWNRIGYHPYEGLVVNIDESERVAEALRPDNIVLVMRNHGLLVVGHTPRDAFERTRDLLTATRTQLLLEASGADMVAIEPDLCDVVVKQWEAHDRGRGKADWPAWLRTLGPASIHAT